jgi:hypothetical protein
MPWWKLKIVLSANDLKPRSSIDSKCMMGLRLGLSRGQYSKDSVVTSEKTLFGGVPESPATGYWDLRR